MNKRSAILGAMALLLILGALFPGAWAVTRLDKVNGAASGVNLTTSGNFTLDIYSDVAGGNINVSMNTSDGTFRVFCSNSTLGGVSNVFNTTCDFTTSSIIEGNLTLKVLANYSTAGGQANSSLFYVNVDYTAPVTNASSITLSGGVRLRPGSNRTISVIATDVNQTVANCTLFVNPDYPNGQAMTRDSALANNFSFSYTPAWAGWGEARIRCEDYHTRNTGYTTWVAFQQAGGSMSGVNVPTIPMASGAVAAAGTSREIPRWAWALGGLAIVYVLFFDKKGGKRRK